VVLLAIALSVQIFPVVYFLLGFSSLFCCRTTRVVHEVINDADWEKHINSKGTLLSGALEGCSRARPRSRRS
jgi:hypothetical protein